MDKLVLESKIEIMLDLLNKLKATLKEQRLNKKLEEYLLYAGEKKAEEIVELAISINQELLKSKEKLALSYYESFTSLSIFKLFSSEELKDLASTAGFRNRLAHEYLDVDAKLALLSMEKMLRIYPIYLQKIKTLISK